MGRAGNILGGIGQSLQGIGNMFEDMEKIKLQKQKLQQQQQEIEAQREAEMQKKKEVAYQRYDAFFKDVGDAASFGGSAVAKYVALKRIQQESNDIWGVANLSFPVELLEGDAWDNTVSLIQKGNGIFARAVSAVKDGVDPATVFSHEDQSIFGQIANFAGGGGSAWLSSRFDKLNEAAQQINARKTESVKIRGEEVSARAKEFELGQAEKTAKQIEDVTGRTEAADKALQARHESSGVGKEVLEFRKARGSHLGRVTASLDTHTSSAQKFDAAVADRKISKAPRLLDEVLLEEASTALAAGREAGVDSDVLRDARSKLAEFRAALQAAGGKSELTEDQIGQLRQMITRSQEATVSSIKSEYDPFIYRFKKEGSSPLGQVPTNVLKHAYKDVYKKAILEHAENDELDLLSPEHLEDLRAFLKEKLEKKQK
jgi:hypothetical protein